MTHKQITQAIKALLCSDWSGITPYEINNGYCEDFALDVIDFLENQFGHDKGLGDNATPIDDEDKLGFPGHYWIEYNGMCYDAECPNGVEDWRDLPIFVKYSSLI